MRFLIVTAAAAALLVSAVPEASMAKSRTKCGGEELQCGQLAKVCNMRNGKCCCARYGTYH